MTNWFCSDVQVRGKYPYYADRGIASPPHDGRISLIVQVLPHGQRIDSSSILVKFHRSGSTLPSIAVIHIAKPLFAGELLKKPSVNPQGDRFPCTALLHQGVRCVRNLPKAFRGSCVEQKRRMEATNMRAMWITGCRLTEGSACTMRPGEASSGDPSIRPAAATAASTCRPVKREISAFYDRQVRDGPAGPVYGMGSSGIDRD